MTVVDDLPNDRVIEAIEEATALADLADVFRTDSIHSIYFRAKAAWKTALRKRQAERPAPDGLPGSSVRIDGHTFHVHGITHAGTEPERRLLRDAVSGFLDQDRVIYCEQGIRPIYFEDMPAVCEMDDYLWAVAQCNSLPEGTERFSEQGLSGVAADLVDISAEFRDSVFSLIDAGGAMYGEEFERALGDVAAGFLTDHADLATGQSYEAFQRSQEASEDPTKLHDLQQYYERTFLPQPLEREWLRKHDPELELVSHARNERMATYACYHNQQVETVHLIVGAAHQPGVVYYLEQYRDGRELPEEFQLY